jgi:S-adenosylmethionine:tRNA ribosyltransferase-isomerase
MDIKDFYYHLPLELIAQKPTERRDHSKLMILHRKTGNIEHRKFYEIADYLSDNDVLVLNDTKVIPARLFASKSTGAKIELLILKALSNLVFETIIGGFRRLKDGDILILPNTEKRCRIVKKLENGKSIVEFDFDAKSDLESYLEQNGITPTPPYIKRYDPNPDDKERYQTIYARNKGSSAAPTAGFHFTDELIEKIVNKGVKLIYVTLHIGLSTFQPIKCSNIEEHVMGYETIEVTHDAADQLNEAKSQGKRILAVGTTSVRTLESAYTDGQITPCKKETNLFIYPGYEFKFVDAMITNFHLPDSTLILLVSAFAGKNTILNAYKEAIEHSYRFYSYGDAMFIV